MTGRGFISVAVPEVTATCNGTAPDDLSWRAPRFAAPIIDRKPARTGIVRRPRLRRRRHRRVGMRTGGSSDDEPAAPRPLDAGGAA